MSTAPRPVGSASRQRAAAELGRLRLWRDPATDELRLAGRIDVSTVADVRLALHKALDIGSGDLVVNLAEVEVGDATGLGVLVGAHRRAGRRGRRLVLRGVPPRLGRLLAATKLHRILTIDYAARR